LPCRRTGLGQQFLKTLLAIGGELVDDLRSTALERQRRVRLLGPVLGDQPVGRELLEARIEGAVGERPEHAEQCVEPLAQLVAVHRRLVQQPEHGELEHARALPGRHPVLLGGADVSIRCIAPMYRLDTSKRYVGPAPMASADSVAVVRRRLPRRHAGAEPTMRPRPVVDYGPAKRATLAESRSGSLTRDDACDAHPCPLHAATYHGVPAVGPGPVRRPEPLTHVTYVYGDELGCGAGRARSAAELAEMDREYGEFRVYVVEVCRSEERRVGKEWRGRWWRCDWKRRR